jgi:hypothetical protein
MIAGALTGTVTRVASDVAEDPLGWAIGFLLKVGSIMIGAGLVLGFIAYILNGYAAKTLGDIGTEAAQIWGVFGNVTYDPTTQPLLSVTTSNPVSDIQNMGSDIYRGLDNAWNDMSAGLSAIATALSDLPPAILAIATHGPQILWDGLVGLVGEGLGDLLTWLFPWLIVTGILMLALGLALKAVRWTWDRVLAPDLNLLINDYLTLLTRPLASRVQALHSRLQAKISPGTQKEAQLEARTPQEELPKASEPLPEPETQPEGQDLTGQTVEEVLGESYPQTGYTEAKDRLRMATRA